MKATETIIGDGGGGSVEQVPGGIDSGAQIITREGWGGNGIEGFGGLR